MGQLLPEAYEPETVPEVRALDELETVVGKKKQNLHKSLCCQVFMS